MDRSGSRNGLGSGAMIGQSLARFAGGAGIGVIETVLEQADNTRIRLTSRARGRHLTINRTYFALDAGSHPIGCNTGFFIGCGLCFDFILHLLPLFSGLF
jgi:hypothetical protein